MASVLPNLEVNLIMNNILLIKTGENASCLSFKLYVGVPGFFQPYSSRYSSSIRSILQT